MPRQPATGAIESSDEPGRSGPANARTSRRNPLALMALCVLWEQPAHPYQIVQTLKARHKDAVAKLNYGSLYTVIARLERDGMIEAVEVTRSGNLPPRTTYKVTASGAAELADWLAAIIGEPTVEPNSFAAALSIIAALPPDTAVSLLERRAARLREQLAAMGRELAQYALVVPELLMIESRYQRAMAQAELDFTDQLIDGITGATVKGVRAWRALHQSGRGGGGAQAFLAALASEGFDPRLFD